MAVSFSPLLPAPLLPEEGGAAAAEPGPVAEAEPGAEAETSFGEGAAAAQVLQGGKSSVFQATFNFVNSIVGAGIVGMPFALREAGLLVGMLLMIGVALLINISVRMLISTGIKVGTYDFESLALRLGGRLAYNTTLLSMFAFAFGAQIAYLIVLGDTLPAVVALASEGTARISRSASILISAITVVLPLCLAKDLSSLAWSSLVSISADIILVIIVVVTAPSSAAHQGLSFPPLGGYELVSWGVFTGLGTLSFAFVCQHNSLIVFRSLSEPTLANWSRVSGMSVGLALVLCLVFGLAGYLSFGGLCRGDILLNFEQGDKTVAVARALLAFTMALTYPQECFVARHCLLSLLGAGQGPEAGAGSGDGEGEGEGERKGGGDSDDVGTGWSLTGAGESSVDGLVDSGAVDSSLQQPPYRPSGSGSGSTPRLWARLTREVTKNALFYAVTLGLFSCSLLISLAFSDLGVVLSLTGAVAASMLGYILPPTFFLLAHKEELRARHRFVFAPRLAGDKSGGTLGQGPADSPSALGTAWRWARFAWPYSLPLSMIGFGVVSMILGVASVFAPPGRR